MNKDCEICGANDWFNYYQGKIRDGSFGNFNENGVVLECRKCGVQRLREEDCAKEELYEGDEYRKLLGQGTDDVSFFTEHDKLQLRNLETIWPVEMRGKVIADIGCAAGSFLDHVSGLAKKIIAIEPCTIYHESLKSRGYDVYQYAKDAVSAVDASVDIAVTFSVIEHIENPRLFVEDIAKLLKPGGLFIVSTPNIDDILMRLEPDEYPSFFYRTVHRWYFDAESLKKCVEMSGLKLRRLEYKHRFGLSNAVTWLKDKKPGGTMAIKELESMLLDDVWKNYLEEKGLADYIFAVFEK